MRYGSGGSPYGARLARPTNEKINGLQVQRKPADAGHTYLFFTNWDWTGWVKPQIDLAVAKGANCVKFGGTASGVVQGLQTRADLANKIRQALDYCATVGIKSYWTLHMPYSGDDLDPATDATTLTELVAMAQVIASYPGVIGADMSNEALANIGATRALANATAIYPAVKAVAPWLPLSQSQLVQTSGSYTSSLAGFAPYVDFWDFHPYYSSGNPVDADLASFRSQSWYKPYLIGEIGLDLASGQTAQAARWNAIGTMSRASTDCYGAVGYTIVDCNSEDYGMFTNDGLFNERSWISGAFATWPSHS